MKERLEVSHERSSFDNEDCVAFPGQPGIDHEIKSSDSDSVEIVEPLNGENFAEVSFDDKSSKKKFRRTKNIGKL